MSADLISGTIAFFFTFLIFSYLIGDNPLFRSAVYIFVGVASGYVAAVALRQVLYPDLLYPIVHGTMLQQALLAIPLILSVLLLMKASPRLTKLGMPAMAVLVGASAAVAVGGAVVGTLFPQSLGTINLFDLRSVRSPIGALVNGVLVLAGVITTLVYFHFGARATNDGTIRRFGLIELIAFVGGIFLAIALGVLFAGVYSAALTALIERLHFIWCFMTELRYACFSG